MAVPSSGEITIHGLAKEKVYDNYSSTSSVTGPISLYDLVNGGNTNGSGVSFDVTNTDSPSYPDTITSHAMSEWYSYDHDFAYTFPTIYLNGAYAITTANTSGDTMRLSKGVDGVQTATYSNTNASTYQQISASNTIGYGVDPAGRNYYEVYRNGITYQSGTLAIYLTAPDDYTFANHSLSQYNCSATSLTQGTTSFSYTASQGSQTIDYMYARLYFDLDPIPVDAFNLTASYVRFFGYSTTGQEVNRYAYVQAYHPYNETWDTIAQFEDLNELNYKSYLFNDTIWDNTPKRYKHSPMRIVMKQNAHLGSSSVSVIDITPATGLSFSNVSASDSDSYYQLGWNFDTNTSSNIRTEWWATESTAFDSNYCVFYLYFTIS